MRNEKKRLFILLILSIALLGSSILIINLYDAMMAPIINLILALLLLILTIANIFSLASSGKKRKSKKR